MDEYPTAAQVERIRRAGLIIASSLHGIIVCGWPDGRSRSWVEAIRELDSGHEDDAA